MNKIREARVVTRNVINKDLYIQLNDVLFEAVTTLEVKWNNEDHRRNFVEVIEDYLEDVLEDGKITQYKVVCDHRNNKSFLKQDEILFSVKYKQPHCFNWTTIEYYVNVKK